MQFSELDIAAFVDEPYRSRGARYAREGVVEVLERQDHKATACVHGTHDYRVSLVWQNDALAGRCTCPAYAQGVPCKHMAALAYALLADNADDKTALKKGRRGVMEGIKEYLEQLPPERLRSLLLQEAKRDSDFRKRLDLLRKTDSLEADVVGLRKALKQAIGTGKSVDYDKAAAWANGISVVVDSIARLPREQYAEDVKYLAEYGFELLSEAFNYVDDSNGERFYAVNTLIDLHVDACRHCKIDPELFGEFLFNKELHDAYGFYSDTLERYSDILGERGKAAFRRAADAAWDALPTVTVKSKGRVEGVTPERRGLRRMVEAFYKDKPEILINILLKDLQSLSDYIDLADCYAAAGKSEEAIRTAEAGWKIFDNHYFDDRARKYLVKIYHRYGHHQKALDLLWKSYDRDPNLGDYRAIKASAHLANAWPLWYEKLFARAHKDIPAKATRASAKGAFLVSIYLEEKEPEAAWSAALQWGCDEHTWHVLAAQHASLHPEESIAIGQRVTETNVHRGNYQDAIDWVKHVHTLQNTTTTGKLSFVKWLEALRAAYKIKRNFIKLLTAFEESCVAKN